VVCHPTTSKEFFQILAAAGLIDLQFILTNTLEEKDKFRSPT
jgi:hypothetical protein